jgi:hypothetical protein
MIVESAEILTQAVNGDPIFAVILIMLSYLAFNHLEETVEKLIYGERFTHFLDPIFITAFTAYAVYCVYLCSELNK